MESSMDRVKLIDLETVDLVPVKINFVFIKLERHVSKSNFDFFQAVRK